MDEMDFEVDQVDMDYSPRSRDDSASEDEEYHQRSSLEYVMTVAEELRKIRARSKILDYLVILERSNPSWSSTLITDNRVTLNLIRGNLYRFLADIDLNDRHRYLQQSYTSYQTAAEIATNNMGMQDQLRIRVELTVGLFKMQLIEEQRISIGEESNLLQMLNKTQDALSYINPYEEGSDEHFGQFIHSLN